MNSYTTTFYEINKILTQGKYELGKSVKEYVSNFKRVHSEAELKYILLPTQMEEMIKFIEDCSQLFGCYYNMGEKTVYSNKVHISKLAIERYIFNKCYQTLYMLYDKKYDNENRLFKEKQKDIVSKYSYDQMMDYLEVLYITNLLLRLRKNIDTILMKKTRYLLRHYPIRHQLTY